MQGMEGPTLRKWSEGSRWVRAELSQDVVSVTVSLQPDLTED